MRGENVYGVQWYGCAVRSCVGDGTVVQVYNAICTMNSKLYVRLYAQCGTYPVNMKSYEVKTWFNHQESRI